MMPLNLDCIYDLKPQRWSSTDLGPTGSILGRTRRRQNRSVCSRRFVAGLCPGSDVLRRGIPTGKNVKSAGAPPAGAGGDSAHRLPVSWLWRELLHPLRLALLDFLAREIFFVRRDRPCVPVRVGQRSGAIASELIRQLPHGPAIILRARPIGADEYR